MKFKRPIWLFTTVTIIHSLSWSGAIHVNWIIEMILNYSWVWHGLWFEIINIFCLLCDEHHCYRHLYVEYQALILDTTRKRPWTSGMTAPINAVNSYGYHGHGNIALMHIIHLWSRVRFSRAAASVSLNFQRRSSHCFLGQHRKRMCAPLCDLFVVHLEHQLPVGRQIVLSVANRSEQLSYCFFGAVLLA